jgi:hypothetical protein
MRELFHYITLVVLYHSKLLVESIIIMLYSRPDFSQTAPIIQGIAPYL